MKKLKYFLLLFPLLSYLGNAYSQPAPAAGTGYITGKVIDAATSLPLEFATISIFKPDSTLVTGGITKSDGTFMLEVKPGDYYVSIQFISYKQQTIDNVSITRAENRKSIGDITLHPASEDLDEVVVVGEKSEMVINLDKKIFNVGKDLSNTGNSALDILDNIPSVMVDLDGNISLRGSQNLQILVDGKPSGMVNSGSTDALKNLQGNMVERIEVITNPSARYEAEGMAGIINIVLKKDQRRGVNGSFELSAGYPNSYSAGANVNFRREKINYFINYNIRYNERPGGGNSYQRFTLADTNYVTVRDGDRLRTGLSNRLRGGADIYITPTNTLTLAVLLANDDQTNTSNLSYSDYLYDGSPLGSEELPGEIAFLTEREDIEQEDEFDIEFSLNYEKQFKGKDHKLTAFTHYISNIETEKSSISETIESFIVPVGITESPLQRVLNEESETNFLIQADYAYPFGNNGKLETGYRSEFRNINNPYYVLNENESNEWDTLAQYSNNFDYKENIHAAYFQGGNNFGSFGIQLGLRAELSHVITYLLQTDNENDRWYIDLFPTLHSTYQFNNVHSTQLSYSRRIHRPHFWYLNPFYSYTDPRNFRAGNPNLDPEYTHSIELGYLFKKSKLNFYSGVYYRYTTDKIERVNEVDEQENITVLTPQNLGTEQSFGVEANATLNLVDWWTFSTDFNFYRFMVEGSYKNQDLSSDDYSWNTRLNSKFKLPGKTDMQLIFFYRAPNQTTQGNRGAFYMMNAAISKDILKGKGTLTFNVRDVLNSMRFRYVLDQENLYSVNEHRWSQRRFNVTFSYRLNQNKRMGRGGQNPNGGNGGDFGGDDMGF